MRNTNENLRNARTRPDDEFYTLYTDIEKELANYRDQFRGKVVFCNCDDGDSMFLRYFSTNFTDLGLKRLMVTGYTRGGHGNGIIQEGNSIRTFSLEGDGDFRSEECVKYLEEADIVVTNPPFSLFRQYITMLMAYEKRFLVIGNNCATTYREVFPYITQNRIWYGVSHRGMFFRRPESDELAWVNANWFTNLVHDRRNEPLRLSKGYDPVANPELDNYKAIEVRRVYDIPNDYEGVMAVPVTFLDKYCPEQFEILWHSDRGGDGHLTEIQKSGWDGYFDVPFLNGRKLYTRLFIRKKNNVH